MQTIIIIVILIVLLVIILTFVGSQLGDMFGGVGDFGTDISGELDAGMVTGNTEEEAAT